MSFESCIRDAQARGEIDNDDAEAILERYGDNMKRMGPTRARDELARSLAIAGAEKQRRDLLGAKAKATLLKDIMSYRTPSGGHDMIEAMYSTWEGFGHAGYAGVKQIHEAYLGLFNAKMADVLNEFRRTGISGRRTSGPLARDVLHPSQLRKRMNEQVSMEDLRKASFGEKTSPKAEALYGAFAQAAEMARQRFNELGGAIPKRGDWGMPQSHNEAAVARAFGGKTGQDAKKNWVEYINPLLNWSEMFDPLTGEKFGKIGDNGGPPMEINEDRKKAILGHSWETIVTGAAINIKPSLLLKGRGSIATQRVDHRFFVFKDAKSASEYNRQFGSGDEFTQMMDHLHSMAADIAIMERFGPNPAGMLAYMEEMLKREAAEAVVGNPHRLRNVTRDNAQATVKGAIGVLNSFFEQYRGDAPAHNKLALAGTVARNTVMSALLGSSAIPHAASNWYIQALARHAGGIPISTTIPHLLRAFGGASHEEMLRAGLDVENALFNIGNGAKQLGRMAKIANWSKWLPDRTTHWFGLIPIVEANKGAFNRGLMATMADLHKTDWRDLPERIKGKMRGYGIREPDWRVMQASPLYTPSVGSAKWLRPNEVMDAGDESDTARHEQILQAYNRTSLDPTKDAKEAARIARDVAMKMWIYMHGERELAVPSNSMRARTRIYGSSEAGTWRGEFQRFVGMFKGFIGSFMVGQMHQIWSEMAQGKYYGIRYAAVMALGMTALGMASMQLKQARAGKDFLPMDPATKTGSVSWLRAALTGGSFGIFGDFLASEHSSFGVGPLETLAGPVVEWALAAPIGAIDELKRRVSGSSREPLGTTLANAGMKFARGNTPFLSTGWPVMAAWNRILDQIQMSYDPNARSKQIQQEDRLRKDTGQHFTWRPGQMAPDRLPVLTPSR